MNLETAKIRCDLSESRKVHEILSPLESMKFLKFLDLSFCGISSKQSGEGFKRFLCSNESLERLELKGNTLNEEFCESFGKGIEGFKGELKFLGLSHTSTLGTGLYFVIGGIRKSCNVIHLDVSSCRSSVQTTLMLCFHKMIQLIEGEGSVRIIEMNTNLIEDSEIRRSLIEALDKNFDLDEVNCMNCGEFHCNNNGKLENWAS